MLRFYASAFTKLSGIIQRITSDVKSFSPEELDGVWPDELTEQATQSLKKAEVILRHSLIESGVDQIERIIASFDYPTKPTPRQVLAMIVDLQNRIDDELSHKKFYQLLPDRADMYGSSAPFGEIVNVKFGKAVLDIHEAANCYATSRNVATVYHLMKVLEVVLKKVGKKVDAKANPNWGIYIQNILDKIDAEIKSQGQKTPARRKRLQQWSEIATVLNRVREAWRNPVMHVAAEYQDGHTKDIFDSVKAFLASAAKSV